MDRSNGNSFGAGSSTYNGASVANGPPRHGPWGLCGGVCHWCLAGHT